MVSQIGRWADTACSRTLPFVCRDVCAVPTEAPSESPTDGTAIKQGAKFRIEVYGGIASATVSGIVLLLALVRKTKRDISRIRWDLAILHNVEIKRKLNIRQNFPMVSSKDGEQDTNGNLIRDTFNSNEIQTEVKGI